MTRETGFLWHESYAWHDTGSAVAFLPPMGYLEPDEHVESPETKRRLYSLLAVSGLLEELASLQPRRATDDELCRFHTRAYVERLEGLSASLGGGDAGELSPMGPGSEAIARLAAGGAMVAAEAVCTGGLETAYALVRPPGHHAEADRGRGFCLYGNTALAVMHVRETTPLERIAVVDVDVHHGNGTEAAFRETDEVLTVSIHQDGLYPPGSGGVDADGAATVNVPLPPGSGTGAYEATFDRVVDPALEAFDPECIVYAVGYDASALDPIGGMILSAADYRWMTDRLLEAAGRHCDGRLVAIHEGGYSSAYVPFAGHAVLETLADVETDVVDPFTPYLGGLPYRDCQPHQEAAVEAAAERL